GWLSAKHGSQLLKSLTEFEASATAGDIGPKVKTINERATLFRITTNAMINACNEFVSMGQSHSKKWSRLLQHEHQQRVQLQ
ncbi:hypothetical protein, partial [Pseudomonas baetica]|uniref:hypothetical protein n=1 Tax=Pseudomonas baetica TaxID=674054 RepID=UPI002871D7CE